MDAPGLIRRLQPVERHQICDHLLRLDPEDRVLRFGGLTSDAQIDAHCEGLDWSRGATIGHFVDGQVRGLGRLEPTQHGWRRAAEAALSVERPFQNPGIGTELLRRLITVARNRSIEMLFMFCLLDNRKVLRRAGATSTFDRIEVEARLPLGWPNHLTVLLELLDEAEALLAGSVHAEPEGAGRDAAARTCRQASGAST